MERRYFDRRPRIEGIWAVVVVLVIIIGATSIFSIGSVGVGYVSVIVDPVFGTTKSVGDGSNARYFFKLPWASIFQIYVATDSINMWSEQAEVGDFPAIEALSKDGLEVSVDITVRWRVSPSGVVDLFRRFPGLDWKERAVIPIIRESVRNLAVTFTAVQTIEQRGEIAVTLEQSLSKAFSEEPSLQDAITIDGVDLRRIALPDRFVKAIESKLAAEQLAIAAEFNKTRLLVEANATAASKIIEAEGTARSRIIIANSTRQAIEAIAAGQPGLNSSELTKLYLYLETLISIADTGKGTFIIAPSDEGQFIIPLPP